MSSKYELIKLLADGQFHSGEELGSALQVTRSAIWKIMHQVKELGIEVHSVKSKGYQIPSGIEFLDKEKVLNHLPSSITQHVKIETINEIDSTNQYLLDKNNRKSSGSIILAEYQAKGRGRRHRQWFSPFGCNLYFSLLWSFDKDPSELSGLSLATGVAVANALEKYGVTQVQLKWPNDILWHYKKLAGILIEMTAETNSNTQVVIGVGINVQMPSDVDIDQEWTDVATIIGQKPKRNLLAAYLIQEIIEMLFLFQQKGIAGFVNYWQALDAYFNKPVTLSTPSKNYSGTARGINKQGEFLLLSDENKEIRFLHGDVSLRVNS